MADNALKKCPFCGRDAQVSYEVLPDEDWDDETFIFVECQVCGCRTKGYKAQGVYHDTTFYSQAATLRAIDAWQRRTGDGNG